MNLAPCNDWNGEERIPEPSSFKSTGFFRATYGSVFQEEREPRHLWDSAKTDPLLPEHWEWEKAGLSGHIAYRRRISYTLGTIARTRLRCRRRRRKKLLEGKTRGAPQLACALWRIRMFSRLFRRRASIIASENCVREGSARRGKKTHLSIHPPVRRFFIINQPLRCCSAEVSGARRRVPTRLRLQGR